VLLIGELVELMNLDTTNVCNWDFDGKFYVKYW